MAYPFGATMMITRSASARAAGIERATTPVAIDFWNWVKSPPGTPTRKKSSAGGSKMPAGKQKKTECRRSRQAKWVQNFKDLGRGDIEAGVKIAIAGRKPVTMTMDPDLSPNVVPRARDSKRVTIQLKITILKQIVAEPFKQSEKPDPTTGAIRRPDELTALNALSRLKKTGRCFNEVEKELRHDLRAGLRHDLQSTFLLKKVIPGCWKEVLETKRAVDALSSEDSPTAHHCEYYKALKYSNEECGVILTTLTTKREDEAIWQRDWYFDSMKCAKESAKKLLLILESILDPDFNNE
jgi:hypothetical protein